MGSIFGKLLAETPTYDVVHTTADYEIRKYGPSVVAECTYDPADFKGNRDAGFSKLANYIGALGNPKNAGKSGEGSGEKIAMTAPVITKGEKIAMTAPVITKGEKIAMTAPVITKGEKIAMTAPVVTKEGEGGEEKKTVTMQFMLPTKYQRAEDAPRPLDESIVIREQPERTIAVLKFSGLANEKVEKEKLEKLRECLERDGRRVVGEHVLARYNPPWALPSFRTNEIMVPVE